MKKQLVLATLVLIGGGFSACANGGGNVTPLNPLNPSPLPTSVPQGNGPTTSPPVRPTATGAPNGTADQTTAPVTPTPSLTPCVAASGATACPTVSPSASAT